MTATTENTDVAPAVAAPSKLELLNAKRAEAKAAKLAAKAEQKAATAAARANGIIGTLYAALCAATGTTKKEILNELAAKFPAKDRDGMAVTVGIQLSRLSKQASPNHPDEFADGRPVRSYVDATRGRVYGFADMLEVPEVAAEGIVTDTADETEENETVKTTETVEQVEVTETPKNKKAKRAAKKAAK